MTRIHFHPVSTDVRDVDHAPTQLAARGRKRTSSFGATASTSAAATAPVPEADERRPRKKQKRPSSTPATPQSSQVFVQLQSRRRSRSRAGSPATDVEYVPPSRASARLARRLHSFLNGRSSDIYTHLAGPDGAGDLLSKPPAGSVSSSTPNETAGSQTVQKPRGRRRKTVDLTDENAKKDLIEEWARMRQSQGTLSLSGVDEGARFTQMQLRDTRKDDESLEPIARTRSLDAQAKIPNDSLSPRMDSENVLSANKGGNEMNLIDSTLRSEGGTEQQIAPRVDIETSASPIPGPRVGKDLPDSEPACVPETAHPYLSQHPTSLQTQSVPRVRADSAVPTSEQAVSFDSPPKDSYSNVLSPVRSFDIRPDSDQEFHMLDISEIFALPWEPVASHLYVPPSLGKLISGTRVFSASLD